MFKVKHIIIKILGNKRGCMQNLKRWKVGKIGRKFYFDKVKEKKIAN